MNEEEIYNIHQKINCVFPFFKSKYLCKKGLHCYLLHNEHIVNPIYYTEEDETHHYIISKVIEYEHLDRIYYKCKCCGKEKELNE